MSDRPAARPRLVWAALLATILVGFFARVWRLDEVPPGWRDDELINSLVISQHVLDGEWAVYYPDASGHEALYHALVAGTLAILGPGVLGIRLVSVMLGTLGVPLTYVVGRRLFGRAVGLAAAAALALSFWSLMYSRIGLRHISLTVFVLLAFHAFLKGLDHRRRAAAAGRPERDFALAGLFLGIGFYTYFASRGVPFILLGFCLYLGLFARPVFRRAWPAVALTFGLAALLAAPLAITLLRQPESEARVEELAVPLTAAREGDLGPLLDHVGRTLGMFHRTGDDEWLYNIPYRPVFGSVGAAFFWSGVLIAVWHAAGPIARALRPAAAGRRSPPAEGGPLELGGSAFLLVWWLAGIAPGFVSVPAASLGHTIVALPAVYLLAALPIPILARIAARLRIGSSGRLPAAAAALALAALLVGSVAARDLPAYFNEWPGRGMVRFLYRANLKDAAAYLGAHPDVRDVAISSLLAGPWDRLALEIELGPDAAAEPRWYNPERAMFLELAGRPALSLTGFPDVPVLNPDRFEPLAGETAGAYQLATVRPAAEPAGPATCFANGLCLLAADYDPDRRALDLTWEVARPLGLPAMPLISNPPPPGVYAGPRLLVFAHLLDAAGGRLAGDDGLWVDPVTLQPGDRFLQQHRFASGAAGQAAAIAVGLYDPLTGARHLSGDGRDQVQVPLSAG